MCKLTPEECLRNLQDSILNGDMQYDDDMRQIRFATERQAQAISIAMQKIIPHISREDRIATLACVSGREPRLFKSTKDFTLAGAIALLDALYRNTNDPLSVAQMDEDTVTAIKYAYSISVKKETHDLAL